VTPPPSACSPSDRIVREAIAALDGRSVERTGDGFLALFDSTRAAVACALQIQDELAQRPEGIRVRIGLNAGEVMEGDETDGRHLFTRHAIIGQPPRRPRRGPYETKRHGSGTERVASASGLEPTAAGPLARLLHSRNWATRMDEGRWTGTLLLPVESAASGGPARKLARGEARPLDTAEPRRLLSYGKAAPDEAPRGRFCLVRSRRIR
jgi:hypothetical protein